MKTIRNGAVPCVEDAVTYMARFENEGALEAGVVLYHRIMKDGLKLPTKDDKELHDHHFICLQNVVKLFLEKAVLDNGNAYQKKLNVIYQLDMFNLTLFPYESLLLNSLLS